ncbi:helix-turn-helix domain-containing protein [Thermomonospora catenispora]|uniref:helix-turn-helix domain-containing protein n=1 Tax=Thermomonospora catenispora TaxID=2493090 RepID=UPI00111FAD3F|nr:helix-turn-helix domain-containing protein [Thermomonospora catenispora]TNY37141.1 XRE family transcriptional regulator [Thermomonospora catenispora]
MKSDASTSRPAMDIDLAEMGRRLRALREERGISLSELARRAGIGKATLSGLETGVRNPTLETLWAVTAELAVPITALLPRWGEPTLRGASVQATLLEAFDEESATYELYRLTFPAGTEQTSPPHPPGTTEHLTVFAGTLRAGPVDAPRTLGPGGHLSWRADVPHRYQVVGADDVQASLLMRYPRSSRATDSGVQPSRAPGRSAR